jgi:hypothetical protein
MHYLVAYLEFKYRLYSLLLRIALSDSKRQSLTANNIRYRS